MRALSKIRNIVGMFYRSRTLLSDPLASILFFTGRFQSRQRFRYGTANFMARMDDWNGVNEVLVENEYKDIDRVLNVDAPVVLDLGSNIGTFALYIFGRKPKSSVISVEAANSTFGILDANRGLNSGFDWKVLHGAVWSQAGLIGLSHGSASTGNAVSSQGDEIVPAVTLSDIVETFQINHIDLIKMDIEGAEAAVLPQETELLRRTGALVIEVHNDRIDEMTVFKTLTDCFPFLYSIQGRVSRKPLVLATRQPVEHSHNLLPYSPGQAVS